MASVNRFLDVEDGVTSIEYSLVALLVAIVILVGVTTLGSSVGVMYGGVASKVTAVLAS